ncbi:nicotinate-nicotinamide nucleotide adenylyltransferase [Clostridium formicaceticum]|uniref:nicotinate-nucleotide adenylyltransferase n=1 Tax=Clostridium formicaceticum TaxID=1497 RepID=A0AAC9WFL4_9CLOT|nr:cytidyltransferase [Clostridium formicaceticum]AOY76425.1 cytidyltransferase [Clostridium formicaceticum]ARE86819.1 nicotinic acid mononucleotide adenylyltransferase [Clostridium formicaceticum]
MNTLEAQKVYSELHMILLEKSFLEEHPLKKNTIKKHLESTYFFHHLHEILEEGDYSCTAVFTLCKDMLEALWEKSMPTNPLHYLYQFSLSLSFPDSVEIQLNPELDLGCYLYLKALRVISQYEKLFHKGTFESDFPLNLLTEEEEHPLMNLQEYRSFLHAFYNEYIYEMMKLNYEVVGHNTLAHICGVHYLAVFIAKQLLEKGTPLDLGRVSGAAAGHDIGKFGCRSLESKRVAYLHYYYTDQWFKRHNIPYIGHIALNHSVWDLELENLSIESLLLIYSDFRVKNITTESGSQEMKMISLKDAFETILEKLDNVDESKEKRYRRVYMKLKDFEDALVDMGIHIDPAAEIKNNLQEEKKYYAIMQGKKITNHLKYIAIRHNINLMYKLRDETSLNEIIEIARAEQDAKIIREYLDIFQEYSTYLTQKQKIIAMKFLYENLVHPEEDIRKQCAYIIGAMIAIFDESYRKEIPEGLSIVEPEITSSEILHQYIKLFLYPDHKVIPLHRSWIRYSISTLLTSLFNKSSYHQVEDYRKVLLKYYENIASLEDEIEIVLMEALKYVPLSPDSSALTTAIDYVMQILKSKHKSIRVSALDTLNHLLQYITKESETYRMIEKFLSEVKYASLPAENFLYYKLAKNLSLDDNIIENIYDFYHQDISKISDMFLNNLKTETDWMIKKFHVELLTEYTLKDAIIDKLYIAMHFCNLLKVSAMETVRCQAGEAVVKIFHHLPIEQRNDIAIELLRTLEIEGARFTKYIPNFLGQIIIYLKPMELDEIIEDVIEKIKHADTQINSLLLKTIGVFIANYPKYKEIFKENKEVYNKRLAKLLGILLNGLVHHNLQIKQVSFSVIGKDVFGADSLTLEEKHHIFQLVAKKILTLLTDAEESELLFLTNSAGLNHIYRFISDYRFLYKDIEVKTGAKVAFFPGSFDPFTLGHKEVAKAIRDLGFEVYLSVDEFSWSKRTQPSMIRKNIIHMSIADEMNVYIYPEDFPVNLANPEDLYHLRSNFYPSEVYIVVGSDVILNASAYKHAKVENSVVTFPHIVFERRSEDFQDEKVLDLEKALENIQQPVIKLNLPPQYEDISSTQIRNYIDENRDISNLIDPLSQKYIYRNNLYRREPQYKSLIQTVSIDIDVRHNFNYELINTLASSFHGNYHQAFSSIEKISQEFNAHIVLIRDVKENGKILGYSLFHWVPSDLIYQEFKDSHISQCIRENYTGRIIRIDGIFVRQDSKQNNLYQIILSETMAYCLKNDYGYGIFANKIETPTSPELLEVLKRSGFQELPFSQGSQPVLAVNMTNPCTLSFDIQTMIKEPFRSNENVKAIIASTRKRLQEALVNLYPGHLVLSLDRDLVEEALVKKICRENEVPPVPLYPRSLGPSMCVPFGNILNRAIVPNTVTKTLHTEKMFNPDMKKFTIGPFPYYLDLVKQARMIHSFKRPVILVDDLLNKGYRMKVLDPILKKENIHVKKIIVGMLSGQGKELMEIQNRSVDSPYFIPKLRLWFNEALFYPFIGGDTLWRGVYPKKNLLPSINFILPYTSLTFIKDVSDTSLYNFSLACINNALDILRVLENTYQKINERKLTLSLLGEVFLYPRSPDLGKNRCYDFNVHPSVHLEKDLELLKRLEYSFTTSYKGR